MKKLLTLLVLIVVATVSTYAQKSNGLYVTPSVTFSNLDKKAPAQVYAAEVGYFGNILGVAGLVETDKYFKTPVYGAKLYAQLFTIENIKIKAYGAAKSELKDLKHLNLQLEPGLAAFVPLYGNLGAKLSSSAVFQRGERRVFPTAGFGLTYRLF